MNTKVALVTGGAKRIGEGVVTYLHEQGLNIIIHYNQSSSAALALANTLNTKRPNSVATLQMNLLNSKDLTEFVNKAQSFWGHLDVLINNASSFFPTPLGKITLDQWQDLLGTNLTAPFFLSQAVLPLLTERQGCIINIVDIKAERPAIDYSVYSIAKAGLLMVTKSLAKEGAPHVRVNAIAPGAMLRPDNDPISEQEIGKIPLKRLGGALDIAKTAYFLIENAPYITGAMIPVDGGRSLYISSDDNWT